MASSLTINVSAASSGLGSGVNQARITQSSGAQTPTPTQIAIGSQLAVKKAPAAEGGESRKSAVQTPKRVERPNPTYGPDARKAKGKGENADTEQESRGSESEQPQVDVEA